MENTNNVSHNSLLAFISILNQLWPGLMAHVFDVICFCLSFPANKCACFYFIFILLYYLFASEVRKTSGLLLLLVVFALGGCCCFLIYAVSI